MTITSISCIAIKNVEICFVVYIIVYIVYAGERMCKYVSVYHIGINFYYIVSKNILTNDTCFFQWLFMFFRDENIPLKS